MTNHPLAFMIVGSKTTHEALVSFLHAGQMEILHAENRRQAQRLLRSYPNLAVVVTETTLPDGTWSNLLDDVFHCDSHAAVIVISAAGGASVWADVLWSGAHDLLVEPFGAWELRRAVEGALRAVLSKGILAPMKSADPQDGGPAAYPRRPTTANEGVPKAEEGRVYAG